MFYDVFKKLCDEQGISPTRASEEIGFSRGSVSYWKKLYLKGIDTKPESYTTEKIADYFGVSVDYLLGRTNDPVDYDKNGDALAEIPLSYVEAADGDMKKARQIMFAADADALRECGTMPPQHTKTPDREGQVSTTDNTIRLAGRDGSYVERCLTDEQMRVFKLMLQQMPNADDL
nr:MAG TPA_asm: repressor protein [Caudoviricetes sp.]